MVQYKDYSAWKMKKDNVLADPFSVLRATFYISLWDSF